MPDLMHDRSEIVAVEVIAREITWIKPYVTALCGVVAREIALSSSKRQLRLRKSEIGTAGCLRERQIGILAEQFECGRYSVDQCRVVWNDRCKCVGFAAVVIDAGAGRKAVGESPSVPDNRRRRVPVVVP